eukprot:gene1443-1922_t
MKDLEKRKKEFEQQEKIKGDLEVYQKIMEETSPLRDPRAPKGSTSPRRSKSPKAQANAPKAQSPSAIEEPAIVIPEYPTFMSPELEVDDLERRVTEAM